MFTLCVFAMFRPCVYNVQSLNFNLVLVVIN